MFIVASGHVSVVREEAGGGVSCEGGSRVLLLQCSPHSHLATRGGTPLQTRELVRRSPGEVVGEFAIFSDDPRKASVTARGQTKVLMLTRDKYLELYSASEAGSALQVRCFMACTIGVNHVIDTHLACECVYCVGEQKVLERITTVPTGAGASSAAANDA